MEKKNLLFSGRQGDINGSYHFAAEFYDSSDQFKQIFCQDVELTNGALEKRAKDCEARKVNFKKWAEANLRAKTDEDRVAFLYYCLKRYETSDDIDIIRKLALHPQFQKIGENIGKLYNTLHHTSPLTYPIINILSRGITQVSFSEMTKIDTQVLKRASLCDDFSILTDTSTNIHRNGPNTLDNGIIIRVINWIKTLCPVPSGSKYPKHLQYMTSQDLFDIYIFHCTEDPRLHLISQSSFMRIRNQIDIRLANFDFSCFCPYCHRTDGPLVDEEDEEDETRNQNQEGPKKTKEEHLDKTQSEAFRKIHRNLREDEVLLVMDFTAFGIPYAKSQFLYLNDLIVTIYEHGGKHDWINYVATSDEKQMFDFVEGSLYDLFSTYSPFQNSSVCISLKE